MGWQFAALWAVDGEQLRCVDVWRRHDGLAPFERATRRLVLARGTALPGHVWETGRVGWIADLASVEQEDRAPAAVGAGLRGAAAFPVRAHEGVVGVIELFSDVVREPDDALIEALGDIGGSIGALIEADRATRTLTTQNELLQAWGDAATDAMMAISGDQEVLGWNRRFVELWEIDASVLRSRDAQRIIRAAAIRTQDPESFIRRSERLLDHGGAEDRAEIALADGRHLLAWNRPARSSNGNVDVRVLIYRDVTEQKHREEMLVSSQRWSSLLAEVSQLLSQSLDLHKSLQQLSEIAVPTLGDWCAIFLTQGDGSVELFGLAHPDRGHGRAERSAVVSIARGGATEVVRTAEPVLYEELADRLDELVPEADGRLELGLRSAVAVPLACRGRVLGAMVLVTAGSARRYSADDLRLAQDIAARAAFPIDNARLYEERDRVAQTLQRNLLPPAIPAIPGVELGVRYEPAGTGAEIGGDFYDIFPIDDRTWGLVIGDVSGKGVEAATITSLARHAIRTAAMATQRPSRILAMLNAALIEEAMGEHTCTAVLAVLRPRFGRLTAVVSRAGHPYPYIVRSDGSLEAIEPRGQLLGVLPEPELHDVTVELGFGDKLVLYTDGAIEVRSQQRFDLQRFEWLLRECSLKGATPSAEFIANTVIGLQDSRPRDDMALLVVGVRSSIFKHLRRREWRWLPRLRAKPLRGRLRAIEDEARGSDDPRVTPE